MANDVIRQALKENGIKHWMLADSIGINESTLSVWLRKPLPAEKERDFLQKITMLAAEKRKEG